MRIRPLGTGALAAALASAALAAELAQPAFAPPDLPQDLDGSLRAFPQPCVRFEYNRGLTMSDGNTLRFNVFRPEAPGRYPVILTHGLYGKDIAWQTAEPYRAAWAKVVAKVPSLCSQSSCAFMRWEMPDPERWVPAGYVVIHADSRGSGKTAGYLDPLSPRETQDYKELIEWAAAQPWSNGKVGLLGISYHAINQWQVAALQPRGLAAIIPWEGSSDAYREQSFHGGIASTMFTRIWSQTQVYPNQHGQGETVFKDAVTGAPATGEPRPRAELDSSRTRLLETVLAHPFAGAYHEQRSPRLSRIEVPTLSVGNLAGAGLHLRGNIEGYLGIASTHKWLRLHSGDHFSEFYQQFELQKAFFDRFLKGDPSAFQHEAPVMVQVRDPVGGDRMRPESRWPLEGTRFERWYLEADALTLSPNPPTQARQTSYQALSEGLSFRLPPAPARREFTGPLMVRLWVSSSTRDADLFVTLRLLDPQGRDLSFEGANAPAVAVTQGWLRLSHRELDESRSTLARPFHPHLRAAPVEPGTPYPADIEIWPTSIVVPPGYTLALTVQGQDFSFAHLGTGLFRGSAPFMHEQRDPTLFAGQQTLHTGGDFDSYLVLPAIPAQRPGHASPSP